MKISFKHSMAAGATALALVWGAQAQATTVTLDYTGPTYGFRTVNTNLEGNVSAGAFNMTMLTNTTARAEGAAEASSGFGLNSNLLAWCVELTQTLKDPASYSVSWANNQSWYSRAQALVNVAYAQVLSTANSTVSAAFQLALWEVVYEKAENALGVGAGDFRSSTSSSNAVVSQANEWLTAVNGSPAATSNYRIVLFTSPGQNGSQDLIALVPTPLPGAALLFASALGLGGLARRARARKAGQAPAAA